MILGSPGSCMCQKHLKKATVGSQTKQHSERNSHKIKEPCILY